MQSIRNSRLVGDKLPAVERAAQVTGDDPDALIVELAKSEELWLLHAIQAVARVHAAGYCILDLLGRGGGGYVFLVADAREPGSFALKLLRSDRSSKEDFDACLARFRREIDLFGDLLEENKDLPVPRLVSSSTDSSHPFFVMQFIPGQNLFKLSRQCRGLEPVAALDLALQAALLLEALSRKDIIHRDIKAENLILDKDGKLWIVDFGLARKLDIEEGVTQSKDRLGTRATVAPEQLKDPSRVNSQADVYSLGCTLFFLLKGEYPTRTSPAEQAAMIREAAAWDRGEDGRSLLVQMLAEEPQDRPTPEQLVSRLKSLLTELRSRQPTLVNECVDNLRALRPAQSAPVPLYDAIDCQRLLLVLQTSQEQRDDPETCRRFIDKLDFDATVQATLKLLADRRGVIVRTWALEPGVVIRYRTRESEELRVLKVLPLGGSAEDETIRRAESYFRTIQRLNHPNLAHLTEIAWKWNAFYAEMEYVRGIDLLTFRRVAGTPAWEEIARIFDAILDGLDALHQRGVAHGDVRPGNVVFPAPGSPRSKSAAVLLGFGNRLDARPIDDLRALGDLLLFLVGGRESPGAGPGGLAQRLRAGQRGLH